MDDPHTGGAGSKDQPVDRWQDRPQRRWIVAAFGEIAGVGEEVFLQVDHHQRRGTGRQFAVIGKSNGWAEIMKSSSDRYLLLVTAGTV